MEQQAQRMHSYRPSSLARSSLVCRYSLPPLGAVFCRKGLMDLYCGEGRQHQSSAGAV